MTLQFDVDQPEAIKRGFNAPSTIKLEIDIPSLTPEQRTIIAGRIWDGWRLDRHHPNFGLGNIPQPDIAGVIERLNTMVAEKAKSDAEADSKLEAAKAFREDYSARLIADPEKYVKLSSYTNSKYTLEDYDYQASVVLGDYISHLLTPAAQAIYQATTEKLLAKQAEQEALNTKKKAEQEAAKEAAAKAKLKVRTAAMDHAVATYGSALQQEMHKRGVLDEQTALDFLADEAFAPLKDMPRYVPLRADDATYPDDVESDYIKLYFRKDECEILTEAQFAAQLKAEQALPGCECQVTMHVIENDDDSRHEFSPRKHSLDVSVTHRGLAFTRSFAID